ncbi:MAG: hypothetical protein IJ990_03070, partial [Alistipes sp.]|nr:hypothetical protein [Alistipes sp.]
SAADSINRSSSRSHWMAAPAMKTSKIKKWSGMSPLLPAAYGKYLKYVPSRANFVHAKICTFFPAVQGI